MLIKIIHSKIIYVCFDTFICPIKPEMIYLKDGLQNIQ
jgi:hypothetical protein